MVSRIGIGTAVQIRYASTITTTTPTSGSAATEFAPVCPQLAWNAESQSEYVDGQEDCLYLNVLAPREAAGPLPVIVDLHGGSNWGFWPHRSAPALLDKGVMVVTPAYRLGTFGFVGHPALTLEGYSTIQSVEQTGQDMAGAVGCAQAADVLACLRATPAEDLVSAVGFRDEVPAVGGIVLPKAPIDLIAERPVRLPVLVGSNREEGANGSLPRPGEPEPTEADYMDVTDNAIEALDGVRLSGEEVRALYPLESFDSVAWALVAMATDVVYTCPMRAFALASEGPVWRYLYTHRLAADPSLARLRAGHFLEEPLLFGDPDLLDGFGVDYRFDAADRAVSETMSTYRANFAKTGDPNGPGMPTWPAFTRDLEQVQVLDDPVTTTAGWRSKECDALRG